MDDMLDILRESDLFGGLDDASLLRIAELAHERQVGAGQRLFSVGEPAEELFLVEKGLVALTMPVRVLGQVKDVTVEEKFAGSIIGWSALVPPHKFTLGAVTRLDTTLLVWSGVDLRSLLSEEPRLGHAAMTSLATIVGTRLQKVQAMWVRAVSRLAEQQASRFSRGDAG